MATLKIRHGDQWVPVQVVAYLNDLANQYDPVKQYSTGDYCAHEMRLFKSTKPTTGEWDATAWEHIVVTDEIHQLKEEVEELLTICHQLVK